MGMVIRKFLREYRYMNELGLVDKVEAELRASGSKQRRNWWDVFAGAKDGSPMTVNGHEFPILRAAQIRQGVPITANARCNDEDEIIPPVKASKRWPRKRLPSKARRSAAKGYGRKQQSQAS